MSSTSTEISHDLHASSSPDSHPLVVAILQGDDKAVRDIVTKDPKTLLHISSNGKTILQYAKQSNQPLAFLIADFIRRESEPLLKEIMELQKAGFFKIMIPMNAQKCTTCNSENGCKINCSHIASRLDEEIRKLYHIQNPGISAPPVPCGMGKIKMTLYKNSELGDSFEIEVNHESLKEQLTHQRVSPSFSSSHSLGLAPMDTSEDNDGDVVEQKSRKEDQDTHQNIQEFIINYRYKYYRINAKNPLSLCQFTIINKLKMLPRRPDGTAQAILYITYENKESHVYNVFVNSYNIPVFLDAQQPTNSDGFYSEIPISPVYQKVIGYGIIHTDTPKELGRSLSNVCIDNQEHSSDRIAIEALLDSTSYEVSELVKNPFLFELRGKNQETPITLIIRDVAEKPKEWPKLIEKLKILAKAAPELLARHEANHDAHSPLTLAIQYNMTEVVQFLAKSLEGNFQAFQAPSPDKQPPLMTAAYQNNLEMLKALIDACPELLGNWTWKGSTIIEIVDSNHRVPYSQKETTKQFLELVGWKFKASQKACQVERLKRELKKEKEKNAEMAKQLNAFESRKRKEIDQLKDDIASQESVMEDVEACNEELHQQLYELNNKLNTSDKHIARIQTQLTHTHHKLAEAQMENIMHDLLSGSPTTKPLSNEPTTKKQKLSHPSTPSPSPSSAASSSSSSSAAPAVPDLNSLATFREALERNAPLLSLPPLAEGLHRPTPTRAQQNGVHFAFVPVAVPPPSSLRTPITFGNFLQMGVLKPPGQP